MTLQKILLGTDKRVIPRQLLQSLRDPFFGILIITPLLQSVGISSSSQIFVNKGVRMVAASSGSALNSSAFRLSWPGAFPFFRELMAWMISLLVGTSVLMSRSVAVSWMFGTTVGMVMTEQSYKTFLSPLSKQRTPLQACITWMTWAEPIFCASCGKSCRDTLGSKWTELMPVCVRKSRFGDRPSELGGRHQQTKGYSWQVPQVGLTQDLERRDKTVQI